MKQITKDTVLKQEYEYCIGKTGVYIGKKLARGQENTFYDSKNNTTYIRKSYPAIQTEQGIVWVDKNAVVNSTDKESDNFIYVEEVHHLCKIIAANFELEGVPKIELEDEVEKLARTNPNITKYSKASFIPGFIEGYKANQAKYTEENAEKIYMKGYMDKTDGKDHTNEKLADYLQSLKSIKEITVDENFKQI